MSADITAIAQVIPAHVDTAVVHLDGPGLAKLGLFASGVASLTKEVRALCAHPIKDDAEEGRLCELISQGTIVLKELDALRRRHVDPLNAQVKEINALIRAMSDPVEALVGKRQMAERTVLAYRAEKKARLAREAEEAERKKCEAAEREAEAVRRADEAATAEARAVALAEADAASHDQAAAELAAPLPMTRGVRTDSGRVSERERWVLQGWDPELVPVAYFRRPAVLEAVRKELQKDVTAGARDIKGCSIGVEDALTRRAGL
jgi:hypothetical protein